MEETLTLDIAVPFWEVENFRNKMAEFPGIDLLETYKGKLTLHFIIEGSEADINSLCPPGEGFDPTLN